MMVSIPISASTDDAEQDDMYMDLDDDDLDIGLEMMYVQYAGLRFTNVAIPMDAQVDSVFIQLTAHEPNPPGATIVITGEAADNAQTYTLDVNDISDRQYTNAWVQWQPTGPWNQYDQTLSQRTPNLIEIFNEITSRPGWQNGNAVNFIMYGVAPVATIVEAESFDQPVPDRVPKLQIYYSTCQLSISLDKEDQTCPMTNDGSIDLTISGTGSDISINWSTGDTTEDLSNLTPGVYYVDVSSPVCLLSDTIEILPSTLPQSCIESASELIICWGDTAIITACMAPEGYTYQWLLNGNPYMTTTTPELLVTQDGPYSVQYNGKCDLGTSDEILITAIFTLPSDIWLVEDTLFAPPGGIEYQWYRNDALIATTMENYFVTEVSGTYRVRYRDVNGCLTDFSMPIEVGPTSVSLISHENALSIFPNPASHSLRFDIPGKLKDAALRISLFNSTGKLVYREQSASGSPVDITPLQDGFYLVVINYEGQIYYNKFIKQSSQK